jgi:hypothetical protein
MKNSIRPGKPWLDTDGKRIQAHGGSVITGKDGLFYWYGENKEKTVPGSGIWHWGIRAYSSSDLSNWEDRGLIMPPDPDDPTSPLHPARLTDRPHIIFNRATQKYVAWLKLMDGAEGGVQAMTVLTSDDLLGPYEVVRDGITPLGAGAGDFDLAVDSATAKAYIYYDKPHTEIACVELTDDYTDATEVSSSHFLHPGPPSAREAPAHFERDGKHYLITSGTTGYLPNPSEIAVADDYHGPWEVLGDPHPGDRTGTSFYSQVSAVFKHPGKRDLYIALADRWLPQMTDLPSIAETIAKFRSGEARVESMSTVYGEISAAILGHGSLDGMVLTESTTIEEITAVSDYVWLPICFDGDIPHIDWLDEWSVDDFE